MASPLWQHWEEEVAPRLAAGTLLSCFDYDGTLVPIAATPEEAILDAVTRRDLGALAATAGTAVAVVSGRAVGPLAAMVALDDIWLVGLHGLELRSPRGELQPLIDLDAAAAALGPLRARASEIASDYPGVRVEDKGATLALHTRTAPREPARRAAAAFRAAAAALPGFTLLAGKEALEVRPAGVDKGTGLARLRREAGLGALLYVGDDATDEDAFAVSRGGDAVTVRVGASEATTASFSLATQAEVGELLRRLLALRHRRSASSQGPDR